MKPNSSGAVRSVKLSREMPDSRTLESGSHDRSWERFVSQGGSLLIWIAMIWMFVEAVGG